MSISILAGKQVTKSGVFQSVETMSQSTATTIQELSLTVDVSHLGVGTATGFGVNRYLLPTATATDSETPAIEGQEKICLVTGTGEAWIVMNGTSTGALQLSAVEDMVALRYVDGQWRIAWNGGATLATATGTA